MKDRRTNDEVVLLEPLDVRPTRMADWRTRSRTSFAIDTVVLLLGCGLLGIALLDSVVSWPANNVLLSAHDLERLAGVILIPSWVWLLVSCAVVYGTRQRRGWPGLTSIKGLISRPVVAIFVVIVLVVLTVIVVGFVIGAAKGSLRILPNGVHQVSTLNLRNASWTTVTAHEYQVWDARFVREDAILGTFAVVMIALSLHFRRLHRRGLATTR